MALKNSSGKASVKTLLVLIILLLIPVGIFVGVNRWPRSMPEPLFQETDLSIPETPGGNGWDLFAKLSEDGALIDSLTPPTELENVLYIKRPKDFGDSLRFWEEVQKNRESLNQFIQEHQDLLGQLDQILSLPHFVDRQALDPRQAPPSVVGLMDLHRLGWAYLTQQMIRGNTQAAYAYWLKLFQLDRAWLRSARSLLSHLAALNQLQGDLSLLFLLQSYQPSVGMPEVLKSLKDFQEEDRNLQRALIFEYLTYDSGVDAVLDEWLAEQGFWLRTVFNRVLLRRDINQKFRTLLKYFRNPEAITEAVIKNFDQEEKKDREKWNWWFYNPGGKLLKGLLHANYLEPAKQFYLAKKDLEAFLADQIEQLERGKAAREASLKEEETAAESTPAPRPTFPENFVLAEYLEKEPDLVLDQDFPLRFAENIRREGLTNDDIQITPFLNQGEKVGVKFEQIESDSIFSTLGLKVGDILLAVQGADLANRMNEGEFFADFPHQVGGEWELYLFRNGKFVVIDLLVTQD